MGNYRIIFLRGINSDFPLTDSDPEFYRKTFVVQNVVWILRNFLSRIFGNNFVKVTVLIDR